MAHDQDVDGLTSLVARLERAAAMSLPVDVAQDVAQETWARLLQISSRTGALPVDQGFAYLVGVFRKVCADTVRKFKRRRRLLAFESELAQLSINPVDRAHYTGMEDLLVKVVRPALSGLERADIDLWVEAKIEGVGWKVAGECVGMSKSEIARARQRILRFLSADEVRRRFIRELGADWFGPRTTVPETLTP